MSPRPSKMAVDKNRKAKAKAAASNQVSGVQKPAQKPAREPILYIPDIQVLTEDQRKQLRLQGLPIPEEVPYVHKPRARDCRSWIKKDNRILPGEKRKKRYSGSDVQKKLAIAKPVTMHQYQGHAVNLMASVLGLRTTASPFNLVIDDINQPAGLLCNEFIFRALSRNLNVVLLTFEVKNANPAVRLIPGWEDHPAEQLLVMLESALTDFHESLVIVDSLYEAVHVKGIDMTALFELVVMKHCSTLVGVYHQDMVPPPTPKEAYAPNPLDAFKFMATTVFTCKSLTHVLAEKAAKERSLPAPTWGLLRSTEGVIKSIIANDIPGIVLDAEIRRKSGRVESYTYWLRPADLSDYHDPLPGMVMGTLKKEYIMLLDLLPVYSNPAVTGMINAGATAMEASFNLGLTEKQKAARDAVVPPHFDAQNKSGDAGQGGRILYDMGAEDDFDEEEDEI